MYMITPNLPKDGNFDKTFRLQQTRISLSGGDEVIIFLRDDSPAEKPSDSDTNDIIFVLKTLRSMNNLEVTGGYFKLFDGIFVFFPIMTELKITLAKKRVK